MKLASNLSWRASIFTMISIHHVLFTIQEDMGSSLHDIPCSHNFHSNAPVCNWDTPFFGGHCLNWDFSQLTPTLLPWAGHSS